MINGAILLGGAEHRTDDTFHGVDPATGRLLEPAFSIAGPAQIDAACALAAAAYDDFRETSPDARARFLDTIADEIAALGDRLPERAMRETALPLARLQGEQARTVGQLRMFARIVREGAWAQITLDSADPDRRPAPKPDVRRRHLALGPVAVFGASNFPLAFSVAGGDTASALAAGCPVIVKGHPAHPGASELVARAICRAVSLCGLHDGVFSYLSGPHNELGSALVADPRVAAVGFTGSRAGGMALRRIAAERPEPIPVYAEMSAINPVLLLPAALQARGSALAKAYIQSLSLGAGQFCTNPGLLIVIDGPGLDEFCAAAAAALTETAAHTMLTPAIHANYEHSVAALAGHPSVTRIASGATDADPNRAQASLFRTDAESFLANPALAQEVFGPSSLIVVARDEAEIGRLVEALDGQLTATLLLDPEDEKLARRLLPVLERKAGRILANGWPTGVEVCDAMVHGGPWPATSDSRTSSVGSLAIERFLRPVCYQNLPSALLPDILRDENPWGVARRIDGEMAAAGGDGR
jgi:NADP-dependent aldehyde dehydrogenase